ncbi:MAG: hypothetical protein QOD98_627 [Nocardioidaceae bacterium]|jgi:hypothetical protein|nr:hypothetical protein [Nocardioidaceae bacterium]
MWRRVLGASIALMVLCIVGFVGTLVWHSFGGDYDKYGRIDVPGSGTVSLPAGEVEIHYAVRLATNGGGGALTVPNLSFSMDGPDGARGVHVTEDIGGTVTVNSSSHVRVWKLQVKDAGDYSVTTDGDVGGFIAPQLTFGQRSPLPAWPTVVFALGFVIALGLVLVAGLAAGHGAGSPSRPKAASEPGLAPPSSVPYGSPSTMLSTSTPDQELARLARLQQLTELHASGTLSDAEYESAKGRLG